MVRTRPIEKGLLEKYSPFFWKHVDKTDACWLWTSSKSTAGYGQYLILIDGKFRAIAAHRFSLAASGVELPKDMVVDHICRTLICVNPEHLRVVSNKTNSIENSSSVCAINARKTECKRGHALPPFDATSNVPRICKTCKKVKNLELRQRRLKEARDAANKTTI